MRTDRAPQRRRSVPTVGRIDYFLRGILHDRNLDRSEEAFRVLERSLSASPKRPFVSILRFRSRSPEPGATRQRRCRGKERSPRPLRLRGWQFGCKPVASPASGKMSGARFFRKSSGFGGRSGGGLDRCAGRRQHVSRSRVHLDLGKQSHRRVYAASARLFRGFQF